MTKNLNALFTTDKLMSLGAHMGSKYWDTTQSNAYLGFRDKSAIINLEVTRSQLIRSFNFLKLVHRSGGRLLFVNTSPMYEELVKETAERLGHSYLNGRWIGGLLTNWSQVSRSIKGFREFRSKYEKLMDSREITMSKYVQYKKVFTGLQTLENLPDVLVVLNGESLRSCIVEANAKQIPVVGFACGEIVSAHSKTRRAFLDYPVLSNTQSLDYMTYSLNSLVYTLEN
uniref:Ribosomal protein S2 n=1 Tax=Chloroparvula japonica TaxID=1411623 RepID=A0A4D6C6Y2_9CHLO|nr:ribosomal protein S2 [Chloroparvula japonica]QBX98789.1 ribosomal protein S2 [Chloroparvula japonica]